MLPLLGTEGRWERVYPCSEGDFCCVVVDDVVFRNELVDSIPPESAWSFGAIDAVWKT